jgi:hypothetical protein
MPVIYIIDKYGKMGDIMLAGDFNARTGSEPDFIVNDNILHIPIDNTNYNFLIFKRS